MPERYCRSDRDLQAANETRSRPAPKVERRMTHDGSSRVVRPVDAAGILGLSSSVGGKPIWVPTLISVGEGHSSCIYMRAAENSTKRRPPGYRQLTVTHTLWIVLQSLWKL